MRILNKPSLPLDEAQRIAAAALRRALELDLAVVIVVVDESGIVKGMLRMDGASFASLRIAEDKAYTAAAFGVSTHEWPAIHAGDPALKDGMLSSVDRFSCLSGGLPIVVDGALVGAIGVSGGTSAQDLDIAQAGLLADAADDR